MSEKQRLNGQLKRKRDSNRRKEPRQSELPKRRKDSSKRERQRLKLLR